jgi:two-component system CheB/CheR fusion protein
MSTHKPASAETSKAKSPAKTDSSQFPIVGIGASAGGLEALEQFFGNMPKDNGMAFVVIQHLDPNHKGIMPELLQRISSMKVSQAADGLKVKQNCVYVIPPNKSLSILNGALHLFDPVETRGLRLPVDIFFRSLADDRQEQSIGIILSGMGSDGSLGLKAIKEKNGIVLVQDPASAKFDGMPRSATEAVIADIIAPAEELPARLIAFLKYVPALITDPDIDTKTQSNLDKIVILLREQSGHDFSQYKKNTLFRRIERRKGVHQIDKLHLYVRYLQENPKEVDILFKELLIGVTGFFRDAEVWAKLKETILPALMSELPDGHILRAWVTACSTGEEAYSLAIVFQEVLEKMRKHRNLTIQIFATDIDHEAIEIARKGYFSRNIAVDVSPERLSRFFKVKGEGYSVITAIREMLVFAPQNVIKDPPFTKLDILTCRNLLIYLEPALQKKVITLFNYSLNQGGIMLLGTAETLGNHTEGFDEVDSRLKFFKRTVTPALHELIDFPSSFARARRVAPKEIPPAKVTENIQTLAEQIMLQRFAPASVLVNDKGDILFITGRTGKYLEPAAGKTNVNIFAMAREGLSEALPNAFRKAMQNFDPVFVRNIRVGMNGGTQYVDITVQRIENPDSIRGNLIVVFADVAAVEPDMANLATGKRKSTGRVKELAMKLQRSYEDLQSTREEMQTSQEELKSTNEELQSTNEELQSTNEELTTSKEEMQSLNEELQTVNVELQSKIGDFVLANNDMKNLLNSTEIATLFLDRELNVRRFTDSITEIIKLRKTDIGRPFTELASSLLYPEIDQQALQVLQTLIPVETAITTHDGRWFTVRIMPYRTLDDRIDGLVITFNEITIAKKLELEVKITNDALAISETRYRRLFETSQDGILILDAGTGKITDVNPFLIELLGYSKEQFIEKAIWEIGFLKDIVANKDKFLELQQKEFVRYEDLPLETADGRKINVEFISNVYSVNEIRVIQCQIRDITDRKLVEELLGKSKEVQ